MRIISYNVNGIRAAITKGFLDWLQAANPDVICLQEIKATEDQIPTEAIAAAGYPYQYYFSAEKKGYSGVAILSKTEPINVVFGTGIAYMDAEGRNVRADFDGVSVMSLYLPSGTNIERLSHKFQYMDDFQLYINQLKKEIPNLVIESSVQHGIDPQLVEALAFAWLAWAHQQKRPANMPAVTGAKGLRVLGAYYPAA